MKVESKLFLNGNRIITPKQLAENFNEQEVLEKWRDGSLKDFLREIDSEALKTLESRDLQDKELFYAIIKEFCLDNDTIEKVQSRTLKAQEEQSESFYRGRKYEEAYQCAENIEKYYPSQSAIAQRILGLCYLNGNGVGRNLIKAKQFLEQAAAQKDAEAQVALGRIYLNGLGMIVSKDEGKAVEYFQMAADQDNGDALYELSVCYKNGIGTLPKDDERADELFSRALDKNSCKAFLEEGKKFREDGDLDKAQHWYRRAAKQGASEAYKILEEIKEKKKSRKLADRILAAALSGAFVSTVFFGDRFMRHKKKRSWRWPPWR